jgi:hypothetical protein
MMKNLTLALGLMIIATPAFATTARLNALGETGNTAGYGQSGSAGSYYIQDVRNIFLNPAQLVHYKKKLVLEYAPTDLATGQAAPQGLFTNTFGDFTYGLSMGNNSVRATSLATAASALAGVTFLPPARTLEAFFAGEGSLNWGISAFYAGNNARAAAASEQKAYLYGVRAGVDLGNFQVFTTVGIGSKTEVVSATNPSVEGKLSLDVGATYTMDNSTVWARYNNTGADLKTATPAATLAEQRNQVYGIGFGHKYEASKSITLFGKIEANMEKFSTNGVDTKNYNVPVSIGAEAQALSWLALRGSVNQSIIGQSDVNGVRSILGNTFLGAGAGLTFGDVVIDGTLNAALAPAAGFGIGSPLANVAMTYNF